MRVLLLNPPHPSIGSRIPREHLPPLGLLALGGPLLDAGHHVKLLDAEFGVQEFYVVAGIEQWTAQSQQTERWKMLARDAAADGRVRGIEQEDSHKNEELKCSLNKPICRLAAPTLMTATTNFVSQSM